MKLVSANFKGRYKEMILGPLFKLFEAVLELIVPLVMANIIDVGIPAGDKGYIIRKGFLMLGLAILGAAAGLTCQYYAAVASGHFGSGLRKQLYTHFMKLSGSQMDTIGKGAMITRLTNDVNQAQNGVNMAIRLGTRVPFLALGSLAMALMINLRIGLIFVATAIVIGVILTVIVKITLPGYANVQAGQENLSRISSENLSGVRVIRAFSKQKSEQQEFSAAGNAMTALLIKVGGLSAALNPLTTLVTNIAIAVVVWMGASYVYTGQMKTGEIVALVSYMSQILLALLVAANIVVLFTRAFASAKRIEEVLRIQPDIAGGEGQVLPPEKSGNKIIEFKGVSYAYYEGADSALENISFSIGRGDTVGIIGGTGSGKTTLINLIMRYADVGGGSIEVSGTNIKEYNLHNLRGIIGLVPQKARLFSGSIAKNISMGKPYATKEVLWDALETAQAGFVKDLDKKLDYMVEEGGSNLSGGQKQRLTIARALVADPEILILDDSFSALDYGTESALLSSLKNKVKKQKPDLTILIASQRIRAIKNADLILVLDNGSLIASGSHTQLLQTCSVYKDICASQDENGGEAL